MKKSLFRKILFFLSVPKCVSCKSALDIDDFGICKSCTEEYNEIKSRNCSRCAKILSECTCSNEFLEKHKVKRLVKVFRYVHHKDELPSNNLIFSLKRDNRNDVLVFLAEELSQAIKNNVDAPENYMITYAPRRNAAIKKYGIDHSSLLAKAVAKKLGCQYFSCLKSKAKSAQKKMVGQERMKNAEFKIKNINLRGKRVILIDDIVTTGASLGTCAELLHAVGAKEIIGAVIAVAYNDKYESFVFW